jgi:outer membrane receptor protein involved in Fe transport
MIIRLFMALLLGCVTWLSAAETGKLSGLVSSADGPLAGVNVQVAGTRIGTSTDLDGRFTLLAVPAGPRELIVSHVGYRKLRQEVWSIAGESIRLELQLLPATIKGEELLVRARRNPVPLTRSSRMAVIDGDALEELPVPDLAAALQLEAGLTRDDRGDLHLRGGRTGELKFLVDGVEVQDPYSGDFAGMINESAVQELVLVAGTFNAEYGDAMSGVVNIVTRRAAPKPELRLHYRSADLSGSPWRNASPFAGVSDEENWQENSFRDVSQSDIAQLRPGLPGEFRLGLAGPIAAGWEARLDLQSREEDSHLPHGYSSEGVIQLNLGRELASGGRLDFGWERARMEEQLYSHRWKYLPENQARTQRGRDTARLSWSRLWTPRLVSQFNLSVVDHSAWTGVLDEDGDRLDLEAYLRPTFREEQDFYRDGHSSTWSQREDRHWQLSAELSWQATERHELKTGWRLMRDELDSRVIHNVWGDVERFEDQLHHEPMQAAVFFQDRMEFSHLVLNAGLRLDWRDPDAEWWSDPLAPYVEIDGEALPAPDEKVDAQASLSPRLGVAFPFTDTSVLHAAYGHFLQFAPYSALYGNHDRNMEYSRTPLLGNPSVKPQKTVAWEVGLNQDLPDGARLSIAAWYKDLSDLLSTREVIQYTQVWVVYHNTDFANVRGVDISWSRPLGPKAELRLDYTWMNARGNAAEPESGLIRAEGGEEPEFNEFPLDYEQIHDLAARLLLKPLPDLSINLLAETGSGLPYTPFIDIGVDVPTNSANRPWTARLDASLRWRHPFGYRGLLVWLEARNLLDRRNVITVYPSTGDPFEDPRGLIGSSPDALHDPSHVEAPRSLRFGFQLNLGGA